MKALITGATSGIGRDMAYLLSRQGYELIIASRDRAKMEKVKKKLGTPVETIVCDLSCEEDCYRLYEQVKDKDVHILINNAGYGAYGKFSEIPIEKEINMLNLNVRAVHVLTKLFLNDFKQKDKGYILNVASFAGFMPGPLLAAYYAGKAYVLHLTEAIHEELRREGSNVQVSVLCPGPVDTNFNERANARFAIPGMKSSRVAAYALLKMFEGKLIIIPGALMQAAYVLQLIVPRCILRRAVFMIQNKKGF